MREAIINFCVSKKTTTSTTTIRVASSTIYLIYNLISAMIFSFFFARGIQAKKAWKWPAKISCILI